MSRGLTGGSQGSGGGNRSDFFKGQYMNEIEKPERLPAYILAQRQSLPMSCKAIFSTKRINAFYDHYEGQVVVGFSGGKDSRVVLDLVRKLHPDVRGVFSDTGLEYPEIRAFVKTFEDIDWIKPVKTFKQVISEFGVPILSKQIARALEDLQNPTEKNKNIRNLYLTGKTRDGRNAPRFKLAKKYYLLIDAPFRISAKCCAYLKEKPLEQYAATNKVQFITGLMAADSERRRGVYLQNGGCVTFGKKGNLWALGIWTEADVWEYIKKTACSYCCIYDKGEARTGCIFCGFGLMFETESENRFTRLKKLHPKLYDYCMEELGMKVVLEWVWRCMKKSEK